MDELEDDLRRALQDPRRALAAVGDPVPAVLQGVRRRRRARVVVAASFVAVAAVALGAVGLSNARNSDRSSGLVSVAPSTSASPSAAAGPSPQPSASPSSAPSATSGPVRPVPVGFTAADLSFVSADRGWSLGTAPCSTPPCTSLLRTSDGGRHWSGGPAPVAPLLGEKICTDERQCVRSVRFADTRHGYAFGGALLTTDDGGETWNRQPGPYVDALEPSGGDVLRVVHRTDGCPPGCTYSVQRAAVGSSRWATVTTPTLAGNGALLLRHGTAIYLLLFKNPAGGAGDAHPQVVVSRDGGATWTEQKDPCGPSAPNSLDERDATYAATAPDGSLAVLCTQRGAGAKSSVVVSADQGRTFGAPRELPAADRVLAVAASSASRLVVSAVRGSTFELLLSEDGGATWRAVASAPGGLAGRGVFLGFTTTRNGTATQPDGTRVWRTTDAGVTWSAYGWGS